MQVSISNSPVILVLGMHRSGTSALAGTFSQLGLSLGDDLMPATADANPKGYFEHVRVVQAHDRLLAALGMDWADARPLPESWLRHPVTRQVRKELEALVRQLLEDGSAVVIKDPRACRFVPLWRDLLADMGVPVHFAFIVRHPVEVAASLRRRDGMSEYRAGLLSLAYQLEAEQATRGASRLFITYEDLIADWRLQVERCRLIFGVGVLPESRVDDAVDSFLDAQLRNHRATDVYALDPEVVEAYRCFQLAAGPGMTEFQETLDAIRVRFEAGRRGYAAATEAALSALAVEHERHVPAWSRGLELVNAWGSPLIEVSPVISPKIYVRAVDGMYSEELASDGVVVMLPGGVCEATMEVAADLPLERVRFDPDGRAGVYELLSVMLEGNDIGDLSGRVTAVHEHRLVTSTVGMIAWATQGGDPWVELDLSDFQRESSIQGGRHIAFKFRRLTAFSLGEMNNTERHTQQMALLYQLGASNAGSHSQQDALLEQLEANGAARHSEQIATLNLLEASNAARHSEQLTILESLHEVAARLEGSIAHTQASSSSMQQAYVEHGGLMRQAHGAHGVRLERLVEELSSLSETVMELKHRSDRPLFYRMNRKWQARRLRHRWRSAGWVMRLEPIANVDLSAEGQWCGHHRDPQFFLCPTGMSAVTLEAGITAGWYVLSIDAHAYEGQLENPCLYPDYGRGISDSDRIGLLPYSPTGRSETVLYLGSGLRALRLDPSDEDARFDINVRLRPVTRPMAWLRMLSRICQAKGGGVKGAARLLRRVLSAGLQEGPAGMRRQGLSDYQCLRSELVPDYARWLRRNEPVLVSTKATERLAALPRRPLLSVVMPVYEAPERWLRRALDSVIEQHYPEWELCISDDASPSPYVREVLEEYRQRDQRIKVVYRLENGHISESSNSALQVATGEFMVLLDHDDELHPEALLLVAEAICRTPDVKLIYSDEDKIDERGNRFDPYFKPDWNYDLFLGQNCVSHLGVYSLPLVLEIGGFRKGLEGSQDWDLALRFVERIVPNQIVHIPRVLYHWRAIQGSTALAAGEKNYAVVAGRRAVEEHLVRTGQGGEVSILPASMMRIRRTVPKPAPKISLVIPTRDRLDLLSVCVDSILERSSYPNYEILVVDNDSTEQATLDYFAQISIFSNVRVLSYPGEFNYSAINNFAVAQAQGEVIGLVNNDIEVISADWMEEMVGHVMRPDVGAVGAMLYYPDDTIQHAGVLVGLCGVAGHIGSRQPRGSQGYFGRLLLTQELSAVTAACLLVRKSIYEEVGGLDERLRVAFNDIDLCLRIRERGYRNLWTPFAELYHHESASRGLEDNPVKQARFMSEVEFMRERWESVLQRDPAYSSCLSLSEPFALKS